MSQPDPGRSPERGHEQQCTQCQMRPPRARHCSSSPLEVSDRETLLADRTSTEMATLARIVGRFALATPSAPALLFMPAASTKLNVW